jgi:sulfotransferase
MKKIVFTSGLPRSGSTLLSAILNQNPRFHADMTVRILDIFDSISLIATSGNKKSFDGKIENIFRSILETFHEGEGVHFNHNRGWTGRTELLKNLYPDFKIIVTVRDICWILDSFERISIKNPSNKSIFCSSQYSSNIYTRCDEYMNLIWHPYDCLKELIHKDISNAIIIDYDVLVSNPEIVMKSIYEHIDEPYFQHDFNNIENLKNYKIYDNDINSPGLHYVRKEISKQDRVNIIPQDIIDKYSGMEIWKNLKS